MRKILLATASIAGLGLAMSASAQAADVVAPEPVCVWCGFHVGVGGGAGYNFYDASSDAVLSATLFDEDGDQVGDPLNLLSNSIKGDDLGAWYGFGTVEIGFDFQFDNSPFVIGVLANYDFNGSNDAEATSDTSIIPDIPVGALVSLNNRVKAELDDSWFLGARLGFATGLMDSQDTLIYALGGYTWVKGKVESDHELDILGTEIPGSQHNDADGSVDGWTLGAGIEHLITENLSLKLEYRHDFLDDLTFGGSTHFEEVISGPDDAHIDLDVNQEGKVDFSRDTIRAVLSWRFNPGW